MSGEYHGWDQEEDHWRFAEVVGRPHNDHVFVIERFGDDTTPRQALSAIMSAMAQFQARIQVVQNDRNTRLITKLKQASMLRVASIRVGDSEQWGVLGVQTKTPKTKPWWKFW